MNPSIVHIDITGKCNLNCLHCRGRAIKDLTTSEILVALRRIHETFGDSIKWIEISGGEPLLQKDLYKILKYIKFEFGWKIIIVSNGWYISSKVIKDLEKIGVERIQISLDGAKEETHNKIRGNKQAYRKALEALKLLVDSKITAISRMVLNQYNCEEVEDFFKLNQSLGVDEIGIRSAVISGNAKDNEISLDDKKYVEILQNLPYLSERYGVPYYSGDPLALPFNDENLCYIKEKFGSLRCLAGCSIGSAYIYITCEGIICPCPNLQNIKLGNVLKDNIRDIWDNSEMFTKCRNRQFKGKCNECKFKFVCGGCRVFAHLKTGDYFESDLRCPL